MTYQKNKTQTNKKEQVDLFRQQWSQGQAHTHACSSAFVLLHKDLNTYTCVCIYAHAHTRTRTHYTTDQKCCTTIPSRLVTETNNKHEAALSIPKSRGFSFLFNNGKTRNSLLNIFKHKLLGCIPYKSFQVQGNSEYFMMSKDFGGFGNF